MPVRSLRSSVLRWPDTETVHRAAVAWSRALAAAYPEIVAVGYFGSYARGEAGVGSDLDVIVLVRDSGLPFERRAARWGTEALPVPVDLLVYTLNEWADLPRRSRRFGRMLGEETVWLVGEPPARP